MPTTTEPTLLEQLHEKRGSLVDAWAELVETRETARGEFAKIETPTDEQRDADTAAEESFRTDSETRKDEIVALDKRIDDQDEIVKRRAAAAEASAHPTQVVDEPKTYERYKAEGEAGISYYRDMAAALVPGVTFQSTNSDEALRRLQRHAAEVDIEMPKRAKARLERAHRQVDTAERRELAQSPFERRVEPNRTDGQGGYFVPPFWMIDEYTPGLRAHLVAAALCRQMDLPMGTDSINIPKLSTLTAVGYQAADSSGVVSQDWSDTAVTANVKTIAGQSDVAIQLLEQSPNQIVDEVVTTDLMAAYNTFLDLQVVAGDGLNTGTLNGGHLQGLYPANNWGANNVTYTDGSPSGQHFISVFGAMASQIARTRYDKTNLKFVVHGRRWFWYSTSLDVNGRPLGESVDGGRYNVAAANDSDYPAEGLVGSLPSVGDAPVYIDDNIPTTDTTGGGTAQDVAMAALWDDLWLFQGEMRTNVYREILSGSLGIRFQVYNYAAFLARYGQSIAIATGSGFAAPVGSVAGLLF